ncbi:MAG: hypothetical protein KBC67_03725, partial [Candidatus Pacebacteria bacterium]|nr:hypothetical protein [Candidatus Paceibacterota bacterium]
SLVTKDIELTLQNASKAEVNATESLKAEAMNASKIEQYGKADIDDVKTNNGSAVSTSHN